MVSSCVGVDQGGVICSEVSPTDDDAGLTCPTITTKPTANQLFILQVGSWKLMQSITCDKNSGKWKDAALNELTSPEVICADKQPPNPPECAPPTPDCTGVDAASTNLNCREPTNLKTVPR
ncbi:hypothetical protein PMAYCL1PPCAC_21814, partial [Pristionchus mayeri]